MFRFGNFVFTQDGRICFLHFEIIIYFAEWCTLIDLFLVCFVPLFACRSETRRSACPSPSPYVGIRLDSRKLEKKNNNNQRNTWFGHPFVTRCCSEKFETIARRIKNTFIAAFDR